MLSLTASLRFVDLNCTIYHSYGGLSARLGKLLGHLWWYWVQLLRGFDGNDARFVGYTTSFAIFEHRIIAFSSVHLVISHYTFRQENAIFATLNIFLYNVFVQSCLAHLAHNKHYPFRHPRPWATSQKIYIFSHRN